MTVDTGSDDLKTPLDWALAYIQRGWRILPCWNVNFHGTCECGDEKCKSPGKHPITSLVPRGVLDATAFPGIAEQWWKQYPNAHIGLSLSGKATLIDVDPRNGGDITMEMLEDQHGKLEPGLMAFTGGDGFHYLYLPTHLTLPGTLGNGIDLKQRGYFIAEPSGHASGGLYYWEASSSPVDDGELTELPKWVLDMAKEKESSPEKKKASFELKLSQTERRRIRSALLYIADADDYHLWLEIGMALHSLAAGNEAFALWAEWSSKSDKFNPKEQRKKWRSFDLEKTKTIGIGTLFHHAAKEGWEDPTALDEQHLEKLKEQTKQANQIQGPLETEQKEYPEVREFPVTALNEIAAWIDQQLAVSHPSAVQHATMALACHVVSRRFISPYNDPLSAYIAIGDQTTGNLRGLKAPLHQILSACGLRKNIRGTRLNSAASIYGALWRAPNLFYMMDDYGALIKFAHRQPSGAQEQALSALTDIHSGSPIYLAPEDVQSKDEQEVTIYHPCISLVSFLSHDQLTAFFRQSEIGRGSSPQFFYAQLDPTKWKSKLPEKSEVPAWFAERVRAVRNLGDKNAKMMNGPGVHPLLISPLNQANMHEYELKLMKVAKNDQRFRPFVMGAINNFKRFASALGSIATPSHAVITKEMAEWTYQYVLDHLKMAIEDAELIGFAGDTEKTDVYDKVVEWAYRAGERGVTKRDMVVGVRAYRKLTTDQRDDLMLRLQDDGTLVTEQRKINKHSGAYEFFIHRNYVKSKKDDQKHESEENQ